MPSPHLQLRCLYGVLPAKLSPLALVSGFKLQQFLQMHLLVHDNPFLTQGQTLRADGRHDDLLLLAVFLPQEQPFKPTLTNISESAKHRNHDILQMSVKTAVSLVDCMFSYRKANNVFFSSYFQNALDR